MKADGSQHATLARHYLRWLVSLFLALAGFIFAATLAFVMLPLAERSADDLAGLMVLTARTWVELPADARPAFEADVLRAHQLALQPNMPSPPEASLAHGFYVHFLELSLQQASGTPPFWPERQALRPVSGCGPAWWPGGWLSASGLPWIG